MVFRVFTFIFLTTVNLSQPQIREYHHAIFYSLLFVIV